MDQRDAQRYSDELEERLTEARPEERLAIIQTRATVQIASSLRDIAETMDDLQRSGMPMRLS